MRRTSFAPEIAIIRNSAQLFAIFCAVTQPYRVHTPRKKPQRRRSGRIAFIAFRERVHAGLDRGASMIAVYDTYAAQLGMSYVPFTRYVNTEMRSKPPKSRGNRNALAAERGLPDAAA